MHDLPSTYEGPLWDVQFVRTASDIGVHLQGKCGCGAQVVVSLAQFRQACEHHQHALGIELIICAVNTSDNRHTFYGRRRSREDIIARTNILVQAWIAHVRSWRHDEATAALQREG